METGQSREERHSLASKRGSSGTRKVPGPHHFLSLRPLPFLVSVAHLSCTSVLAER